ncbi:MAG: hypothetical protein ACMUJM_01775 [bacterium]
MKKNLKKSHNTLFFDDIKEFEIRITPEGRVLFSEWHKEFMDFAEVLEFYAPHLKPIFGNKLYCG